MLDKKNCGAMPRPHTWHELNDDGSWGFEVCSLKDAYSCDKCEFRIHK